MGSRKTLCPSDNRHCAGGAKNTDENHVAPSERKAKTKTREQGKSDQRMRAPRLYPRIFPSLATTRWHGIDGS